jgi:FkbM family methyltransferase
MAMDIITRYGKIKMNITSRYKKEHEEMFFEREFIAYLENESYDIFIDVGAAWGYFSIPASHYCEKVYAFEPQAMRLALLMENIQNLERTNIVVDSKCVGTGKLSLFVNKGSRGMVGPKHRTRTTKADVDWITLKKILDKSPDKKIVVKIDVEGAELDVIESAGNLKDYPNVVWLIERHQRGTYGYSEEELMRKMHPFKGKLVGTREWTSHYIFER